MVVRSNIVGIDSPQALEKALRAAYYLADDGIATASYLSLALGKPLLLEGAPGVGKTEAAKATRGATRRMSQAAAAAKATMTLVALRPEQTWRRTERSRGLGMRQGRRLLMARD